MLARLFVLLVLVFQSNADLFGMFSETKVYSYVLTHFRARFNCESQKMDFKKNIESKKMKNLIQCVNVCGTMLWRSILDSDQKLNRVLSLIKTNNITEKINTQGALLALTNLNNFNMPDKNSIDKKENLLKLSLFVPGGFDFKDWLSDCNNLLGKDIGYELSSFNENYTLEEAIYILFDSNRPGFWDSEADKFLYVKYVCGAIRTYLYFVENFDVKPSTGKPSYFSILMQCYDFYSNNDKKRR